MVADLHPLHGGAAGHDLPIDPPDAERLHRVGLEDDSGANGSETGRTLENDALAPAPPEKRREGQASDASAGDEDR
jgi:hypothetical protein